MNFELNSWIIFRNVLAWSSLKLSLSASDGPLRNEGNCGSLYATAVVTTIAQSHCFDDIFCCADDDDNDVCCNGCL